MPGQLLQHLTCVTLSSSQENGRRCIVVPKASSSKEGSIVGLAKYAWSGYVLECGRCGVIYRWVISTTGVHVTMDHTDQPILSQVQTAMVRQHGSRVPGRGSHRDSSCLARGRKWFSDSLYVRVFHTSESRVLVWSRLAAVMWIVWILVWILFRFQSS